jgi:hypothetical protein
MHYFPIFVCALNDRDAVDAFIVGCHNLRMHTSLPRTLLCSQRYTLVALRHILDLSL